MREYSCIIVDDEVNAIKMLEDTINEVYPSLNIICSYSAWREAIIAINKKEFDILFLDIDLSGRSGFDLLSLLSGIDCEIIFVTAHEEFAINAFQYPATGYVLKPVEDIILFKAIEKAIHNIDKKTARSTQANKIAIPNNRGLDYVEQSSIIYIEALAKNTRIKANHKEYISSQSFGFYKKHLTSYPFYQVHRSFIINLMCIERYESFGVIIMNDSSSIPIARNLREDFLKRFGKQI